MTARRAAYTVAALTSAVLILLSVYAPQLAVAASVWILGSILLGALWIAACELARARARQRARRRHPSAPGPVPPPLGDRAEPDDDGTWLPRWVNG